MLKTHSSEHFGKTVSLLWLFAILNQVFRDLHEMSMASTINEILSGYFEGNPVTEWVLFAGAFGVEALLLGFLLSALLSPRAARILNLVLAPMATMGFFLVIPNDPDDYFFAVVTLSTFAVIFVSCWTWKPVSRSEGNVGGGHAA